MFPLHLRFPTVETHCLEHNTTFWCPYDTSFYSISTENVFIGVAQQQKKTAKHAVGSSVWRRFSVFLEFESTILPF